ncbi:MAG: nascent polypeptide-associated complex protein [Candidatus Woesearchaeota archaeon]|jgi:nascent polypeptide-associated complex subunit alpha|nr:nascent polypeptide-associated complex protein [Candidatus Woesearchaeota archaeon]
MIPGVDPRQLKSMMRQMGMSQVDLDTVEVIIKTTDKVLVFKNPSVQKVIMKGQTTFQIAGAYSEDETKAEIVISEEDIKMVSEQASVSLDVAKETLKQVEGDIAEAIVKLSE